MGDSNRPPGRFESKPFRGKQRAVGLKRVRKYRVERLFRRIAASAQTALFVNLGLFVVPRPHAQLRENVRGVVAGPAPARDDAALAPLNQKVKNAAFFQFRGRRVERYSLADRAEIQFDPLLLKGDRTRPSRDIVLALAFALHCTLRETERLLQAAGVSRLYVKERRDAIVIFCLDQHATLAETNEALYRMGEKTIG